MSPSQREDNRAWSRLAEACAFLVPLAQRESGLWAFPTNYPDGRQAYAAPGTKEEKDRLSGPFGFESITITWNALEAINGLFSHKPAHVFEVALADIANCRAGDAFGSRSTSYQGVHINLSTRHTALAVLSFLFFESGSSQKREFKYLERTVRWILRQQNKKTFGWGFDKTTRETEEPMSMASCLAALSCFITVFDEGHFLKKSLRNQIEKAVRQGFHRLMGIKKSRLWTPRYKETHIVDNAFVFDMLEMAVERGSFELLVPGAEKRIGSAQERYIKFALHDGWPEKAGGCGKCRRF